MSSQLDNRVSADEFHAYASNDPDLDDPDLDDLDDYEITELPIILPVPSLEPQDFLRARRRYHTPESCTRNSATSTYSTRSFCLSSTYLSRTSGYI